MDIAPDPKTDTIDGSDDEFAKHFSEFASGEQPDPDEEKEGPELGAPDGNGPAEDEPSTPAEEAAAEGEDKADGTTSGDAEDKDGGQPSDKAPDIWASIPDEVKPAVEQIVRERDEAIHRASSDANRVAALSRKLHQLQSGQPSGKPQSQPTEAQKALDDKIKKLKEDLPDEVADPLIDLLEHQREELTSVRTQLEGMGEAQMAQVVEREAQALEARHPDWRNIARSGEFAGWITVQPDNIQRLANSWDARETSVVLSLFKAEMAGASGPKPPQEQPKPDAATGDKRSQQLDGGRDVRSRPAPAASGPPEDFDAAFNYFVEKRRLANSRR